MADIIARSGHASDIQAAVDQASLGDNVLIPEGTFNFYEVGETWKEVVIPAGINLFGAPTERTGGLPVPDYGRNPNDQVIEWKTVLVMPFEAPNGSVWFRMLGKLDPTYLTRFSDIQLVGYREIDSESITMYHGISIFDVTNFRIDHCNFRNLAGGGVSTNGTKHAPISGVIDHNIFWNLKGIPAPYEERTLGYGIMLRRSVGYNMTTVWEEDVAKIFGHYLSEQVTTTVFIEDNAFYRWRHCVASNDGFHYVARYNTILEGNYGNNIFDQHGPYEPYPIVGGRAVEIYRNRFETPVPDYARMGSFIRGGSGLAFDNWVGLGWRYLVATRYDYPNLEENERCLTKDVYVWGNHLEDPATYPLFNMDPRVTGIHQYPYTDDNPYYVPYPYPHPLAAPPIPPIEFLIGGLAPLIFGLGVIAYTETTKHL